MVIWHEDKQTGVSCGINDDGWLFIGDNRSGYNLPNTEKNRQRIIHDYQKVTGILITPKTKSQ